MTIHNVPERGYQRLIGREADVREIMVRLGSTEERNWIVAIEGIGGLGKTALAQEVAWRHIEEHDYLPAETRYDAIIWVTARTDRSSVSQPAREHPREHPRDRLFTTLNDVFRAVAEVFEIPTLLQVPPAERLKLCWAALQRLEHVLLVVDNLEEDEDDQISAFLRDLPGSTRALVTTRFHENLPYPVRLKPLDVAPMRELLRAECEAHRMTLGEGQLDELARGVQGMPLAARLIVGQCAQEGVESALAHVGDLQARVSHSLLGHSVARLQQQHPQAYQCLLACACFDLTAGASTEALAACLGLDAARVEDVCVRLEYLNLLQPLPQGLADHRREGATTRYMMLPVIRDYAARELRRQSAWEPQLRARWVSYYHQAASLLADPAQYARAQPEAANLIAVMRWLASHEQLGELAWFFRASQEFLYAQDAQNRWDELLGFATALLALMEQHKPHPSDAEMLIALLQAPIDIYRRQGQLERQGLSWLSRVAALAQPLHESLLDAELDLARRRLLCHDGSLDTTMQFYALPHIAKDEINRYLKLEDPNFVEDVDAALRTFRRAGRADRAFQAHATLGNYYRVRSSFKRAAECYDKALAVLEDERPRSAAWCETRAAVVRASQALIAGRQGRFDEACEMLGAVRVALVDAVDRVEADIARAYYEYRRGNRDKAFERRTDAIGGKAKLGLRDVLLCLEDRLWREEVEVADAAHS